MKSSQSRRRLAVLIEATAALGIATAVAVRLSSYNVPFILIAPCWFGVFGSLLEFFDRIVQAASVTTHRCREAGCDFKVSLRHVGAAENRHWQEVAAAHPRHQL